MLIRSLLFAVTLLSFAACQDDLTAEKQTWEAATQGWAAKVDKLKKDQEALNAKMKTLVVNETDAALAADKAALDKSIETSTTVLSDAEKAFATAKTSMGALISAGKKVPVQAALGTTKATVDGVLAQADSLLVAANGAVDSLNAKVAAAKTAADEAKGRAEAWATEVKQKGGQLAAEGVRFNAEALDVEKSKDTLNNLVTALKACAELKTELSVTAIGEAEDLASKRADALKAYFAANGVNAAVLAKVVGQTFKEGNESVSVVVTTPCK